MKWRVHSVHWNICCPPKKLSMHWPLFGALKQHDVLYMVWFSFWDSQIQMLPPPRRQHVSMHRTATSALKQNWESKTGFNALKGPNFHATEILWIKHEILLPPCSTVPCWKRQRKRPVWKRMSHPTMAPLRHLQRRSFARSMQSSLQSCHRVTRGWWRKGVSTVKYMFNWKMGSDYYWLM